MPKYDAERFFKDIRDWQWIKHTIFAEYIAPWATIVGKYHPKIHIVDAFAGAGSFTEDGTDKVVEGTPMLAAKQAIGYNKRHEATGRRCDLICVEKDPENFDELQALLLPRFQSCVTVWKGEYEGYVERILQRVDGDPMLLLLDPIGLKAISAERIRPLIARQGKTDVFLTLHFGIVHRAAGFLKDDGTLTDASVARANVENVDGFFAGQQWRAVMLEARASRLSREVLERRLVDLFFQNVASGHFKHCSAYPVRSKVHAAPRYWLAHLGDDWKPFWLMNDGVAKVDGLLLDQTYEDEGAIPGLGASIVQQRSEIEEQALSASILSLLRAHPGGLRFGEVRSALAHEYFGRVRESAYSRASKKLIGSGAVRREVEGLRAKLEDTELLAAAK